MASGSVEVPISDLFYDPVAIRAFDVIVFGGFGFIETE
jgi:hypothetical protein